jgi:hypothetical protein
LVDGEDVQLKAGQKFSFVTDTAVIGDNTRVAVTYGALPDSVTVGGKIMIDDGLMECVIVEIKPGEVVTEVHNGGMLGENKGVNLPGVVVQLPAITEKVRPPPQISLQTATAANSNAAGRFSCLHEWLISYCDTSACSHACRQIEAHRGHALASLAPAEHTA